jgi:recombination protein RecA
VATDLGVLEKRGSWLAFEGQQLGQGREATKDFLRENAATLDKIVATVKAKVAETGFAGKRLGGTEE